MALSQINKFFDALAEADRLRTATKGIGTNEAEIISVLGNRPSHQRVDIVKAFKTAYGKDLVSTLESEISGNFLKTAKGLCCYLSEYDARCLRKALEGAGTDEDALIDILSCRTNQQIMAIKEAYSKLFKRDLEKDVVSDTSNNFRRVLVSLLTANRDESQNVVPQTVQQDVEVLYKAGEQKLGTDEVAFNRIMCVRSFAHIAAIAKEYERKRNKKLVDVLRSELSGNYEKLLLSIVLFASDPAAHAASVLYRSMKGIGTNDKRLQRAVITNCESNMPAIKAAFQKQYGTSLAEMIRGDTSGDYRKLLLTLIGEA